LWHSKKNKHKLDVQELTIGSSSLFLLVANGRIPAIVDKTAETSGFAVFEGAAIQLYLTSRYDPEHKLSFPYGSAEYWEMVSWLSWMHAGMFENPELTSCPCQKRLPLRRIIECGPS
jgi:glutathione S-transferase